MYSAVLLAERTKSLKGQTQNYSAVLGSFFLCVSKFALDFKVVSHYKVMVAIVENDLLMMLCLSHKWLCVFSGPLEPLQLSKPTQRSHSLHTLFGYVLQGKKNTD